jgi:hypothetical protein
MTTRISVRGTARSTRASDLVKAFGDQYASAVSDVWLARNPPGFGFFALAGDKKFVDKFIETNNGKEVNGRALQLEVATLQERPPKKERDDDAVVAKDANGEDKKKPSRRRRGGRGRGGAAADGAPAAASGADAKPARTRAPRERKTADGAAAADKKPRAPRVFRQQDTFDQGKDAAKDASNKASWGATKFGPADYAKVGEEFLNGSKGKPSDWSDPIFPGGPSKALATDIAHYWRGWSKPSSE